MPIPCPNSLNGLGSNNGPPAISYDLSSASLVDPLNFLFQKSNKIINSINNKRVTKFVFPNSACKVAGAIIELVLMVEKVNTNEKTIHKSTNPAKPLNWLKLSKIKRCQIAQNIPVITLLMGHFISPRLSFK
jgi:hypothetical protein